MPAKKTAGKKNKPAAQKIKKAPAKKAPAPKSKPVKAKAKKAPAPKKPAVAKQKPAAVKVQALKAKSLFSRKELEEISKILLNMKKEIFKDIDQEIKEGSEKDSTEYKGDNYDIAASERDRELSYMLGDRERKKIKEIDIALEKIKDGSYGICDECGEPISKRRLELIPYTSLCINCQTHMEEEERMLKKEELIGGIDHIAMIDEDDAFKDRSE